MLRSTVLVLTALAALPGAGCVQYKTQVVSVEASAGSLPDAPEGPLVFEQAVRLLVERNPQLKATRAAIAAVNTNPGPRPLVGSMQVMDGRAAETMIGTDVLSLLGIGPRKEQIALARAMKSERVRAHHERARDLVADLAEAFAVEAVLAALPSPETGLDMAAFEAAGLASRSILAAGQSVVAEGQAEVQVRQARLLDARRAVAELIGAAPDAEVYPVGADASWPSLPAAERERLVLARGDLQRLLASWRVADSNYRFQIARQIPNLILGFGGNVNAQVPMQLIGFELPLDAPAEARAAEQSRRVAFHELDAGILGALHEAEAGRLELDAATARLRGAEERRKGAAALLEAERANLQTDPAALDRVVLVAGRVVEAARRYRGAAVAEARMRVRAARAAGWPTPEIVGGDR